MIEAGVAFGILSIIGILAAMEPVFEEKRKRDEEEREWELQRIKRVHEEFDSQWGLRYHRWQWLRDQVPVPLFDPKTSEEYYKYVEDMSQYLEKIWKIDTGEDVTVSRSRLSKAIMCHFSKSYLDNLDRQGYDEFLEAAERSMREPLRTWLARLLYSEWLFEERERREENAI